MTRREALERNVPMTRQISPPLLGVLRCATVRVPSLRDATFPPFPPAPRVPPPPPSPSLPPLLSRSLSGNLWARTTTPVFPERVQDPKLDSDARDRRVSFSRARPSLDGARDSASRPSRRSRRRRRRGRQPQTPGQTRPGARGSLTAARACARAGTGRSVAARTFSLVLPPRPPVDDSAARMGAARMARWRRRRRPLGSRDGASGVAGRSEGASGSGRRRRQRRRGVGTDAARAVSEPVDAAANLGVFAANANANAGEDDGTIEIDVNPDEDGMMSLVPYRSSREPPSRTSASTTTTAASVRRVRRRRLGRGDAALIVGRWWTVSTTR